MREALIVLAILALSGCATRTPTWQEGCPQKVLDCLASCEKAGQEIRDAKCGPGVFECYCGPPPKR